MELDWASLRRDLEAHSQEHLLRHLEELTEEEKACLYKDIKELDLSRISSLWKGTQSTMSQCSQIKDDKLQPLDPSIVGSSLGDKEQLKTWRSIGLERVANNQVAVLLLAGGQGTRLKVSYPKGMYDVGLPSRKSLYQIQAERLRRLQTVASQRNGRKECVIPWYIMTSEHTSKQTLDFFEQNSFFGLKAENVYIFEQNTLPCMDFNGKILLSSKHRVARAPDGNGGLYSALASDSKVLADMRERGVVCVHVYCVDNILVKMADPVFMGFCCDQEAECGAKVVKKIQPTERVGVVCCYDDQYAVVEYSEISSRVAELRDPDGSLTYDAGNICNHFFTLDFLERVCREHPNDLCHHVAKKKIPFINENGELIEPTQPNGVKLEKFIFDVFAFTKSFSVLEVERCSEFSPVKNAPGAAKDSPITAREDLYHFHWQLLSAAGAKVVDSQGEKVSAGVVCEISPLISYCGEGLEELVAGKTLTTPVHLEA